MKKLTAALLVLASLSFFFACKKSTQPEAVITSPEQTIVQDPVLYQTLLDAGIKREDITDDGQYYVIYEEIRFKKKETDIQKVKAYFRKQELREEQAFLSTIGNDFANSIKVKVNTNLFSTWEYPTRLAMQHWTDISNCRINFHMLRPTDPDAWADIRFEPDNGALNVNTIADAEFPSSGNPGWRVRYNTDFYSTSPGSSVPVNSRGTNMIYNAAHEIGHTIGLLHTNQFTANIPGTSSSDAGSVMNGGTALNLWNGFSTGDITAAQFLYPNISSDSWISYPGGDFHANWLDPQVSYEGFPITWNPTPFSSSTVTLQLLHNRTVIGTIASGVANNGSFSFTEGHYNSFFPPMTDVIAVQVRIISDASPSIAVNSTMFFINWE